MAYYAAYVVVRGITVNFKDEADLREQVNNDAFLTIMNDTLGRHCLRDHMIVCIQNGITVDGYLADVEDWAMCKTPPFGAAPRHRTMHEDHVQLMAHSH